MKLTTTTRTLPDGTIITETRNEQDNLHDSADGTPARIFIYKNGHRVEEHWTNGKLSDAADGTPARIWICANGDRKEERWKDGAFVSARYINAPGSAK